MSVLSPPSMGRAPDPDDLAVEVHGLYKRFGVNTAVNGVELCVPRGCAFGYLGPNGAGKTTLMRVLLGLTHADAGTMRILGHSVPKERDKALARVGAIVDEPRFHRHLSGRENLAMLASSREPAASERIDPALERVGLGHRAEDKVAGYSMGMRQRLGVAACLLGDPELLVLDEPMNGLDPAGMSDMREMILSFVDEGRTVVLSSHLLDEVQRTCDSVAIVDRGTVVRQGPIAELLAGSSMVLEIECSEPERAWDLVRQLAPDATAELVPLGLSATLPPGAGRPLVAEISRLLIESGIDVYRVQPLQASLESWFLEVTSRLGATQ
jgi:ABC-2 type transport system ATP-binding protein